MTRHRLKGWYYLNSNTVKIRNARSSLTGQILNDIAGGTAQKLLVDGTVSQGPVPLTYTPGSQGEYTGSFEDDGSVLPGKYVDVLILLPGGPTVNFRGVIHCQVVSP